LRYNIKVFLLALILAANGCSKDGKEYAIGPSQQIVVIADKDIYDGTVRLFREVFERTIETPYPEKIFRVRYGDPKEFDFFKKWKSVVIVSVLSREDYTSRLVKSFLTQDALQKVILGEASVFSKPDLWAEGQAVIFLVARDLDELKLRLRKKADLMFNLALEKLDERISDVIYGEGEESAIMGRLHRDFGWSLRIPKGYELPTVSKDSCFVWLRKSFPERWLFVYWGERWKGGKLTEERCVEIRNKVGKLFYDGDRVASVRSRRVDFDGREALRLEGTWENPSELVGGPFFSYCFVDSTSSRIFIIDGAVFLPGQNKLLYIRQLQLIAETFSL